MYAAVRPQINPQTRAFCTLIGIDDYFSRFPGLNLRALHHITPP